MQLIPSVHSDFSPSILIEEDQSSQTGILSNDHIISILKAEMTRIEQRHSDQMEKITKIYKECSPCNDCICCGSSSSEQKCTANYTYTIKSWTLYLANAAALASASIGFAYKFWANGLQNDFKQCNGCNYTSCIPTGLPDNYICPRSVQFFLARDFIQDAALITFVGANIALIAPWMSKLETWMYKSISEKIKSYSYHAGVAKIQTLIQRLNPFGSKEFNSAISGPLLSELPLPEQCRKEILKSMNAAQFIALKKSLKPEIFDLFCDNALTDTQDFILTILEDLGQMSLRDIEVTLLQSQKFIEHDESLWDVLVDEIEEVCDNDSQVKEILLQCGIKLKILTDTDSVSDIRKMLSIYVSCDHNIVKSMVHHKKIIKYKFFADKITEMQNSREKSLLITLKSERTETFSTWPQLLRYIETQEIKLDSDLAQALMPLAIETGVEGCAQLCYEHLLEDQDSFKPLSFFHYFLKHSPKKFEDPRLKDLFIQRFKESLNKKKFQNAERYLYLVEEHNLPIDLDDILFASLSQIPESSKDIALLSSCQSFPHIYPILEDIYAKNLNYSNFRIFVEYAKGKKVKFWESCHSFYKKQSSKDRAKIFNLWPIGEFPFEDFETDYQIGSV